MSGTESTPTDKLESARCAAFMKALSEPQRLRIVECLQLGPLTVSDIATVLEIEIANASHHLRLMRKANLLTSHREGKNIYYSLAADIVRKDRRNRPSSLDFGCCRIDLSGG